MSSVEGAAAPAASTSVRPRRVLLLAAVAAAAFALDLGSKVLIAEQLPYGHAPVRTLFGAVWLVQTRNSGAAFSLGTGATLILTVVALLIVAVIIRTARKLRSAGWACALGLVLGGALGNLSDRIFRAPGVGRGYVVDWISLFSDHGQYWPIFNLADSSIVCGAALSAILALRGIDFDGTTESRSRRQ